MSGGRREFTSRPACARCGTSARAHQVFGQLDARLQIQQAIAQLFERVQRMYGHSLQLQFSLATK